MAYPKREDCCRTCKHYGWGFTAKSQRYERRVCKLRPKTYKTEIFNLVPHYYVAYPFGICEQYERKEDVVQ